MHQSCSVSWCLGYSRGDQCCSVAHDVAAQHNRNKPDVNKDPVSQVLTWSVLMIGQLLNISRWELSCDHLLLGRVITSQLNIFTVRPNLQQLADDSHTLIELVVWTLRQTTDQLCYQWSDAADTSVCYCLWHKHNSKMHGCRANQFIFSGYQSSILLSLFLLPCLRPIASTCNNCSGTQTS